MKNYLIAALLLFTFTSSCVAKQQVLTEVEMTRYRRFPTTDNGYLIVPVNRLIVCADGSATLIKGIKEETFGCFQGRHDGSLFRLIAAEANLQASVKSRSPVRFLSDLDTHYSFQWGKTTLSFREWSAKQSASSQRIDELVFALKTQTKWKPVQNITRYERDFTGVTVVTQQELDYWGTPPEELGSPYLDGIAVSLLSAQSKKPLFRTVTHDNGHSSIRVTPGKYNVVFSDFTHPSWPTGTVLRGSTELANIKSYTWRYFNRTYGF